MGLRGLICGAAALLLPQAAAPAFAHAGFIYPVLNDANGTGEVILEASFSDVFPVTDVALKSDNWVIIGPDGEALSFAAIGVSSRRTILQAELSEPGTYKFSSGERLGRKGEIVRLDGAFLRLGEGGLSRDSLPEGASLLSSQTATVSDLYLSRGEGSADFNAEPSERLSITPLSDPTRLRKGDELIVSISFDAAPLAGHTVTLFSEAAPEGADFAADADGLFTFELGPGGGAMVLVRHVAEAPEGAETDVRSYSTTLSLAY